MTTEARRGRKKQTETVLERRLTVLEDEIFRSCNQPSPPTKLYHYTREAGFHGILNDRELRLTHFTGTNDDDEIRVADPWFVDVLNRRLIESQEPHVRAMLAQYYELSAANYLDVHIGCFSEAGDLATQWCGYADEGRGYCLEFDLTRLAAMHSLIDTQAELHAAVRTSKATTAGLDILPVIYRPVRQSVMVRRAVDVAIGLLRGHVAAAPEHERHLTRNAMLALVRTAASLACQFKTLDWSRELEWRVTLISPRGSQTTPVTIPFRDQADTNVTPLRSVRVGPSGPPLDVVRRELAELGHDGVRVEASHQTAAACSKPEPLTTP